MIVIKAVKTTVNLGGNELSRFSDTPGDASLDDLFHPLDKSSDDRAAEASTSTSHMNQGNGLATDMGKNDLATKLRATIAQKQMENEMGQTNGGGDLFRLMMGVLKDDVIDIDGLVRIIDVMLYVQFLSFLMCLITLFFLMPFSIRVLMKNYLQRIYSLSR